MTHRLTLGLLGQRFFRVTTIVEPVLGQWPPSDDWTWEDLQTIAQSLTSFPATLIVLRRDYELLDTSLTFALDPKGHLGLTFSYRNGQLVETGQDVDLANIALSVSY